MIRFDVQIEADIIAAYRGMLNRLPQLMKRAFEGEIRRIGNKMLAELTQEPGPPKYPIRWKSERQRRAFFATDGFGRGIPTRRTGAMSAGWQIRFNSVPFGGDIVAFNQVPYARFVQGDDAQPFHLDTGWPQAAPIFVRFEDQFTDALIATWFAIVDFEGL